MILFKTIQIVVRQLIPVLLVFLVGGAKDKGSYILMGVIGIALLSMVYSIINFFKTYFYIENNELVLQSGVFQRKKTSIPFERIQSINFEQNIIHQLFSVLKIKIDTAGSEKSEFEFHAIEEQKAQELRDLILTQKNQNHTFSTSEQEADANDDGSMVFKPIMTLGITDLFKLGFTENHIKSIGLILVFFFWIYQNLQEVGVDVDEYSEDIPEWEWNGTIIITLVAIMMIVSVFISLIRTVVTHFDLQFLRSRHGFKVVSGLFTKKETSAADHKIQYISWSDNLLKRWIGFKDLRLNQASGTEANLKQSIKIPGCQDQHLESVIHSLFGDAQLEHMEVHRIDKRYFTRYVFLLSILYLIFAGVMIWFELWKPLIAGTIFYIYLVANRYLSLIKKKFGYHDELLYVQGGIFGDKSELLPIFKIQALEIYQSPYQSKNGLCNINFFTASGKIQIPYINIHLANQISDNFIYKVETDLRKWM
jgi:putative membrane protein